MSKPSKLTILAEQAVLPGKLELVSAAIDVDLATGKITAIREGVDEKAGDIKAGVQTIRVPKGRALLPGLLE